MENSGTDELGLLIGIAENSGRQSYISDKGFTQLWSNSDVPLIEAVRSLKISVFGRAIHKETTFPCKDGRAMKVTPIMRNGGVRYYFFEIYGSNELLEMLASTSVFGRFTEAAERMRTLMLGYAASLSVTKQTINESAYGRMCSSSVNFMSMLKILGGSEPLVIEDITARLRQTSVWMATAAMRTKDFDYEQEIAEGLYSIAGRNSLEYAVSNLLINAVVHAVPPEGEKLLIRLAARAEGNRVIITIDDSGTSADPEFVSGFREVFLNPEKAGKGEGMGVSLAEVFCRRSGGELNFGVSPLGGLRAEMKLPLCGKKEKITFFAPSAVCTDTRGIADIFLKGVDRDAIYELIRKADNSRPIG